jgi:hypothetical protein
MAWKKRRETTNSGLVRPLTPGWVITERLTFLEVKTYAGDNPDKGNHYGEI